MKTKQIYVLLALILIASGCNDWLDVTPRQEMKETVLYSTEDGYKSAMIGAYLQMANGTLYGKNTSMYMPEMLARHWTYPSSAGSTNHALATFDYTYSGVENLIESIYKQYYSVIVHLNNVLDSFEDSEVFFNYNNDQLIKGEATGLRAFLHFDLLRYFGPVPSEAVSSDKVIPYVTQMTKDPNYLVTKTWQEVIRSIEADLNEAETTLKEVDPIVTGDVTTDDDWHYLYRENRFNYYAVLGTKARFYHWIGDKENAVKYARMVIDATDAEGGSVFTLTDETSYAGNWANLIMNSEIMFGVHNARHQSIVESLFKVESASLTQSPANINAAYEAGLHPDDMRNKSRRYWEEKTYQNSATMNHFYKYIGNDLGVSPANVVPLLRLSEMYFILIENLPLSEAQSYFKEYRIARSLGAILDSSLTDEQAVMERLEKEYRKEFFGEGQMFFFYKRLNYASYAWPSNYTLPENAYVIPLPKSQLAFE